MDLPEVRPVVVAAMVWTAAVAHLYRQNLVAPIDITVHSLLSGALGFLLTHRASEGYNRCVQAREVWDGVLDTSRDMIRAIVACESLIGGPTPARRLLDLTCAYGLLLEEFVTGQSRGLELGRLLQPKDMEALGAAPPGSNRPLVMTELLAEEVVRTAGVHPAFESSTHFPRILGFIDNLGKCRSRCILPSTPRNLAFLPYNTNLFSRDRAPHHPLPAP
jgi:predicted membrane chloride channel (bestrophin family)